MFKFSVFARGFAAICIVGAIFLYYTKDALHGNLLVGVGLVAFVVSILGRKLK